MGRKESNQTNLLLSNVIEILIVQLKHQIVLSPNKNSRDT